MSDLDLFKEAVADIAEVFKFEHWLRYYFISEKEGELCLSIPEEHKDDLARFSQYADLVADLTGKKLSQEISTQAVGLFIGAHIDGRKFPLGMASRVFNSPDFKIELHLFNLWVDGHEHILNCGYMDFDKWLEVFNAWKKTEEVMRYLKGGDSQTETVKLKGSRTVH